MKIVLWDTRHGGAFKDFAGGFGVGQFRGTSLRGKIIEHFYRNDYRSPSLAFGYLAAGLRKAGHAVEYSLEATPQAEVYIFNPALMTVNHEAAVMRQLNQRSPKTRLLVVGQVASTMPECFDGIRCKVLKGEPEQLIPKFEDVVASSEKNIDIGTVSNLDELPFPDWSAFPYKKFRVNYDFWKFPTAYIQSSRGCTLSCSYCPYIILENKVRTRAPELVVEEMRRGMETYGFQSFKFRDPLFGARKKHAEELAERIGKLPRKVQFSVESRIELLSRETLEMLRNVGLTSVTVGIETPSLETLKKYKRAPIKDDKQSQFVDLCRGLGIRVISGFMIGFPEDTTETIRNVLKYAKRVNPFGANFNVCTPYPGTAFINEITEQIESRDWSRYDVYTPNLKYDNFTTEEMHAWHQKCFNSYYFRWKYLKLNWQFFFPRLHAMTSIFTGSAAMAKTAMVKRSLATNASVSAAPQPISVLPIVTQPAAATPCCSSDQTCEPHEPSPASTVA